MPRDLLIYTIGHSDHTSAEFVELLRRYGISVVVDVRSQPYSRWTPQFNRETISRDLKGTGIAYRFMGDTLGGRPTDPTLCEPEPEPANHERLAESATYQTSIDRLLDSARTAGIAVMCSEGDHRRCHRHLLIAQTLLARGARVLHIRPDGTTLEAEPEPRQLSLFG